MGLLRKKQGTRRKSSSESNAVSASSRRSDMDKVTSDMRLLSLSQDLKDDKKIKKEKKKGRIRNYFSKKHFDDLQQFIQKPPAQEGEVKEWREEVTMKERMNNRRILLDALCYTRDRVAREHPTFRRIAQYAESAEIEIFNQAVSAENYNYMVREKTEKINLLLHFKHMERQRAGLCGPPKFSRNLPFDLNCRTPPTTLFSRQDSSSSSSESIYDDPTRRAELPSMSVQALQDRLVYEKTGHRPDADIAEELICSYVRKSCRQWQEELSQLPKTGEVKPYDPTRQLLYCEGEEIPEVDKSGVPIRVLPVVLKDEQAEKDVAGPSRLSAGRPSSSRNSSGGQASSVASLDLSRSVKEEPSFSAGNPEPGV